MKRRTYVVILPTSGHEWLAHSLLREVRKLLAQGCCVEVHGNEAFRMCAERLIWHGYEGASEKESLVSAVAYIVQHIESFTCIINGTGWKTAQTLTIMPVLNRARVPVISVARFGLRDFWHGYSRWKSFLLRERHTDHVLIVPRKIQWLALLPHLARLAFDPGVPFSQRARLRFKVIT